MADFSFTTRGGMALGGAALLALTACSEPVDFDLRSVGRGFDTTDAAQKAAAERPEPDARGIISYPGYQVAVARRGDTVATLAARIGMPAEDLARFNGLTTGDGLRQGEVLALPGRVAEPAGAALPASGAIDVTTLAGAAIDRATPTPPAPAAPAATEPVRHRVMRGETAYSISRLYNVSVKSLGEWNGLGPELTVREGSYLMIPVGSAPPPDTRVAVAAPGVGSPTPEPPSASAPLPDEATTPRTAAATPPDAPASPGLGGTPKDTRLAMPVQGKIIREYSKKKNEGIDIAAAAGTPVVAADDGTVAAITRDTEQVPILVVRHADNLLTVYAGIDTIPVKKGDKVRRGQQIGKVRAGNPAFVHFEVREGFESTDPMAYLN